MFLTTKIFPISRRRQDKGGTEQRVLQYFAIISSIKIILKFLI